MYAVIEMQTNNGLTVVVPPVTYTDRNQAEAKYHQVLSAAAVSNVEIHSCAVLDAYGVAVLNHFYYHPIPEPVVEIEEPDVDGEGPDMEGGE